MKAPDFGYVRPGSLTEALEVLAHYSEEAVPLAGGQSLLATLNMRLSAPHVLVDIGDLPGLARITVELDTVRVGALARHADVLRSPIVRAHLPLLAQAVAHVGHVAIRNRGTFGGSIAFADPAAEIPACVVAMGGVIVLQSRSGRREVPANDFFLGLFETDRASDELIVEVRLPVQTTGEVSTFTELSRRRGDFAVAGLAAIGKMDADRLRELRLVYIGCVDRPKLAATVAGLVSGQALPFDDEPALRSTIASELDPAPSVGWSTETKVELATVLTSRVLASLHAQSRP